MERLREQTGVSLQKQANAALAFFLENVTIGKGKFWEKALCKRINCYRKPIEVVPSVDAEYAEYMRNLNPEGKKKMVDFSIFRTMILEKSGVAYDDYYRILIKKIAYSYRNCDRSNKIYAKE